MGLAAAALALVAIPSAATAMRRVDLAPQEAPIRFAYRPGLTLAQRRAGMEKFTVERRVAAYLDSLRLPRGSVLLDVAFGFPIVLDSGNPKQFVIPPDRDFEAALAAPQQFRLRYFLAVPNAGLGTIDAINRAYPAAFRTGASLGRLVQEFAGRDSVWRLYRVGG